ncbi:hypothetical protein B0A50_03341 [Salinomyces thailandicus]|uniref:Uncharacterized protein n=1 Tax=Salinomyces thailandicus TaxID=706561 RepID=A0A4U0U1W0_9PEZI|nr:hypothetical protein B0A50_03341 [Salinomyces thailandica]
MLGLTLIAALAEVCRIAGVTAGLEEVGHVEVEKVLARFAREGWEDSDAVDHDSSGIREDKGEVISRHHEVPVGDEPSETVVKETASPAEDTTSNLQPPRTAYKRHPTADTARATKKKRKKGNAIDDLFGGLD